MKTTEFSQEVLKLTFKVSHRDEVPNKIKQEARKWFNSNEDFTKKFEYTVEDITVTEYTQSHQGYVLQNDGIAKSFPAAPTGRWTVEVVISRPLSIVDKEEEHQVVKESRLVLE